MSFPQQPTGQQFAPPPPPMQFQSWPVLRKKQSMVFPIVSIALGGLVMAFFVLATAAQPTTGILAVVLSSLMAAFLVFLLNRLDRWEPEPPHLLFSAFIWGGGISLLLVFLLSPILAASTGGSGDFYEAAISAPLVEETSKGLFFILIIAASKRARAEFNSFTDALVYAGFIGVGFAWVEDMLYISSQKTVGEAIVLAGIRLGLGVFGHAIFTAMTAIGFWKGLNSRGAMRFVWPFLGWCAAVFLHALHNGVTFLSIGAFFAVMLLVILPLLVVLIVVGVRSSKREGQIVNHQLPSMVAAGWITPEQAGWLGTIRSRNEQIKAAKVHGKAEVSRLKAFRDNVTELAFVRERLDRMGPPHSPELLAQHDELVTLIRNNQQWVAQHLPQGGWPPIAGRPGPAYGMNAAMGRPLPPQQFGQPPAGQAPYGRPPMPPQSNWQAPQNPWDDPPQR